VLVRVATLIVVLLWAASAWACSGPFRTVRLSGTPSPPASPQPLAADLALRPPSPVPSVSVAPAPAKRTSPPPVPVPSGTPRMIGGVLVGSTQQQLTNQARGAAGLAPLTWNACLAGVAARHAMEMAAAGRIFHGDGVNRDLACGLGSHQAGENVGETSGGVDDQRIFDAFMKSQGHRANILGPYRYVATAWAIGAGGTGYVSVELG
jgi:uncharacterized protein YkwD